MQHYPKITKTVIASVTLTKRLPNRRSFTTTAQLVHYSSNERPHFSVTSEERNLRRREENQVESCGQMHDEVMEHFPELAPIIALHLADDNGAPMYAVENGAYWLGFTSYKPKSAPDFAVFARLWRIPERHARLIHEQAVGAPGGARAFIAEQAEGQAARWADEAADGLALIRMLATYWVTDKS